MQGEARGLIWGMVDGTISINFCEKEWKTLDDWENENNEGMGPIELLTKISEKEKKRCRSMLYFTWMWSFQEILMGKS